MKHFTIPFMVIAGLLLAQTSSLRAQTAPAPPAAPDVPASAHVVPADNPDTQTDILPNAPAPRARSGKARAQTERNQQLFLSDANNATMSAGMGGVRAGRHGHQAGNRPLVVRFSNMDAKTQAGLEEDLAVMAHIFNKAMDDLPDGPPRPVTAMGIDVFFAPGSSPIRSLYLEGYGALFLLNVNFPLVAPVSKSEEEKLPADSTW